MPDELDEILALHMPIDKAHKKDAAAIKQAILTLKKKWENEARNEYYKDGYFTGIKDFSGYFMDASLKSQRNLIFPDIAKELIDNYKSPIWNFDINQLNGDKR